MRKPTIKNLRKDLKKTKKADREKIVFEIIKNWILEINQNREEFRKSFLSDELDKNFDKIKKRVGEFKNISKMSVLDFLAKIILGSKDKFFNRLNEEFKRIKKEVHSQHPEFKKRK